MPGDQTNSETELEGFSPSGNLICDHLSERELLRRCGAPSGAEREPSGVSLCLSSRRAHYRTTFLIGAAPSRSADSREGSAGLIAPVCVCVCCDRYRHWGVSRSGGLGLCDVERPVWWWQTGCGFPKLGREEHQRGMNHHRRQRKSLGVCIISRSDQRRWGFSPLAHLSGARRQQKHMIHMRRCDAMRCEGAAAGHDDAGG